MTKTLRAYFTDYAKYHKHPINRFTHQIAVPLIVFHIIAMLDWVVVFRAPRYELAFDFPITLAHVGYIVIIAWYASLSPRLAFVMAIFYGLCFPLGSMTPREWVCWIAVGAWTIQLAGHLLFEKKSPAFAKNIVQALIGPMYFTAILMGEWKDQMTRTSRSA